MVQSIDLTILEWRTFVCLGKGPNLLLTSQFQVSFELSSMFSSENSDLQPTVGQVALMDSSGRSQTRTASSREQPLNQFALPAEAYHYLIICNSEI